MMNSNFKIENLNEFSNIKPEFGFENYEELKSLLVLSKELEIKKISSELEDLKELYKKSETEKDSLQSEIETLKTQIEELIHQSEELTGKLGKIKASKNTKRIPKSDKDKLEIFTKFLEDSLKNKLVSHYELRREIEKYIKNTSDRDVLLVILQQTIIYKRGMAILTEAQINKGVKSGSKIWTEGAMLSRNTISLSLQRLEAMGFIMRYRKNKHKSVFFINVEKSREIYNKLKAGEYTFEHIVYFIDVEMINNEKAFSGLSIQCSDPEH